MSDRQPRSHDPSFTFWIACIGMALFCVAMLSFPAGAEWMRRSIERSLWHYCPSVPHMTYAKVTDDGQIICVIERSDTIVVQHIEGDSQPAR